MNDVLKNSHTKIFKDFGKIDEIEKQAISYITKMSVVANEGNILNKLPKIALILL